MDAAFPDWLTQLDALFATKADVAGYVAMTGEECWREMYDDGMAPADAFDAEMDAWAVSQ